MGEQGSLHGSRIQVARVPGRPVCSGSFVLHWNELWTSSRSNDVCPLSLWTAQMLTTKLPSWMMRWLNHLKSIRIACEHTHLVEAAETIAGSTPSWSTLGQSFFTSALVDKLGFTRCAGAPQFFWNPDHQVGMEVHTDDVYGIGPDPLVEKFKEDLVAHICSVMAEV